MTKEEKQKYILKHFSKECRIILQDFQKSKRKVSANAEENNFSCYICLKKCATKTGLERHKSIHNNTNKKKFRIIKQSVSVAEKKQILAKSKKDLVTNKEKHSSLSIFSQNTEQKVKESKKCSNEEQLTCVNEKSIDSQASQRNFSYMCSTCLVYFSNISDVKAHHHNAFRCKYLCKKCSRNFSTKSGFVVHVLQHGITESKKSDVSTLSGNILNGNYNSSCSPLHVPMPTVSESRVSVRKKSAEESIINYTCNICYDVFKSLEMLNKHNSLHLKMEKLPEETNSHITYSVNLVDDLTSLIEIKEENSPIVTDEELASEKDDIFTEDHSDHSIIHAEFEEKNNEHNRIDDSDVVKDKNLVELNEKKWSEMTSGKKNKLPTFIFEKSKVDLSTVEELPTISIPESPYANMLSSQMYGMNNTPLIDTSKLAAQITQLLESPNVAAQETLLQSAEQNNPNLSLPLSNEVPNSFAPSLLDNQFIVTTQNSFGNVISNSYTEHTSEGSIIFNSDADLNGINKVSFDTIKITQEQKAFSLVPTTFNSEKQRKLPTDDTLAVSGSSRLRSLLEKRLLPKSVLIKIINDKVKQIMNNSSTALIKNQNTVDNKTVNPNNPDMVLPKISGVHTVVEDDGTNNNENEIILSTSQYENDVCLSNLEDQLNPASVTQPTTDKQSGNSSNHKACIADSSSFIQSTMDKILNIETIGPKASEEMFSISSKSKALLINSSNSLQFLMHKKSYIEKGEKEVEPVFNPSGETFNVSSNQKTLFIDKNAVVPKIHVKKLSDLVNLQSNEPTL